MDILHNMCSRFQEVKEYANDLESILKAILDIREVWMDGKMDGWMTVDWKQTDKGYIFSHLENECQHESYV